jgi:hypothetical protein
MYTGMHVTWMYATVTKDYAYRSRKFDFPSIANLIREIYADLC